MAATRVDGGTAPPRMTIFDPFPVLTVTIEDAEGFATVTALQATAELHIAELDDLLAE